MSQNNISILSTDISADEILYSEEEFKPWLRRIKIFLENTLVGYHFQRLRNRSLKFTYHHKGHDYDVDLLVSPYWEKPEDFYTFLKRIPPNGLWRRKREMSVRQTHFPLINVYFRIPNYLR